MPTQIVNHENTLGCVRNLWVGKEGSRFERENLPNIKLHVRDSTNKSFFRQRWIPPA